jgi:hypothetical protein
MAERIAHFNEKYAEWMDGKAIDLFKEGKSITAVCCALEIDRDTYYEWRNNPAHPFYRAARRGEMLSQSYLESKGMDGIFGETESFAGSSWQFIMKNRFRDSYSDQQKPENNSAVEMLLTMLANKEKD